MHVVCNSRNNTGKYNNVIATSNTNKYQSYTYSDYGVNNSLSNKHAYNSEIKDDNGLIYLHARYYDPSNGRFIQIDNNYKGEKEHIVSNNRYTYTLNNPYKYVDRDGNKASVFGTYKDGK